MTTLQPIEPASEAAPSAADPAAPDAQTVRRRWVYRVLETTMPGDRLARAVDVFLIVLIALNVLAVMLESVPAFSARYAIAFYVFEVFSVAIFSIEYALRVWSSIEREEGECNAIGSRIRFMLRPIVITDLIAVLPFYLMAFGPVDLRFVRVVRLRRAYKLGRYTPAMDLVTGVIRAEGRSFLVVAFLGFLATILGASAIYVLEHPLQPAAFSTIPHAMWWALTTLTGISDTGIVPVTIAGRAVGAGLGLVGIALFAVLAGLLAASFYAHFQRRRDRYAREVRSAMEDGVLTTQERRRLEHVRRLMGFSVEEADAIRDETLGHDQK